MKFLVSFIFVAVCIVNINAMALPDDVKEHILEIKKECMEEDPDLDHDHVEKLMKHEFVEDDEHLKKFVLCFHLKTHMQNEDGSFNIDHMKEKLAEFTGNHDHDTDVDECTHEDHHDALENAWALAKCIKPKLPKFEEI